MQMHLRIRMKDFWENEFDTFLGFGFGFRRECTGIVKII